MGTIDLIGRNDLVGPSDLIGLNDLVGLCDLIGMDDLVDPIGSSLFVVPEHLSLRFDVPSFCEELDYRGVLLVQATQWSSCFARRSCVQTVCCA